MKNYAVNLASKRHRLLKEGEQPAPNETVVTADADGWVEVHPDCTSTPITGDFEAKRLDGQIIKGNTIAAWRWKRSWNGSRADVVAYRPIIKEPKPWRRPEDGLPPIGTRCRVSQRTDPGTVTHHLRNGTTVIVEYDTGGWDGYNIKYIRPLPPPRDQWVEQVLDLITPIPGPQILAQAIYDAMIDGKLPVPGNEQ